jgi:cell division protein FtsL
MKRRILLYAIALTIPLILGLDSWQTARYARVDAELRALENQQREWLESNKRLIAGIAVLGSSQRIEAIARDELKLRKVEPEAILQIGIERRRGVDG